MEYTALGRTGLKASVAGLGCGGPSRLGLRDNPSSTAGAIGLVRTALDMGINFVDTAQSYGTEAIVGKAIAEVPRDKLILSTKKTLPAADHPDPEAEVQKGLEQSLNLLRTDYVDIYHLHGLEPKDYEFAARRLLPAMHRLREQGKIRFIGVTEAFVPDPAHRMLRQSLGDDDPWDVVMVGFNLLNPSARHLVFPLSRERGAGVLCMFAVRRALSKPERLKEIFRDLRAKGALDGRTVDLDDPLGLGSAVPARVLVDAAYRFCRHEPGVDVVLTGTGSREHLKSNVESILKPALPESLLRRCENIFGAIDYLTGN